MNATVLIDNDTSLKGKLVMDSLSLFEDIPDTTILTRLKLFKKYKKKYAETVRNYELLEVQIINNLKDDEFFADGGLGLGMVYDDNVLTHKLQE